MPCVARVVEQHLRAEHVGEDELGRAEDRAVDVRLGGEVDDRLAALRRARDRVRVGDVALVELVLDAFEVRAVARVGQLVEDDDVVAARGEATDEVRADEPGAAGDENPHRLTGYRSRCRHSRRPSRQCGSSGAPRLAAQHRVRRPRRPRAELGAS